MLFINTCGSSVEILHLLFMLFPFVTNGIVKDCPSGSFMFSQTKLYVNFNKRWTSLDLIPKRIAPKKLNEYMDVLSSNLAHCRKIFNIFVLHFNNFLLSTFLTLIEYNEAKKHNYLYRKTFTNAWNYIKT